MCGKKRLGFLFHLDAAFIILTGIKQTTELKIYALCLLALIQYFTIPGLITQKKQRKKLEERGLNMLNKIVLQGRLSKNPELRHTQGGNPVVSFRLAVDRDFKDKQTGEKAIDWIDVVAWRNTAEFVSRYFTKGRMAVVEGRIQMRDWTDKDGNKRTSAEVVADHIYFGDSQRSGDTSNTSGDYGAPEPQQDDFSELADDDGKLPF